MTTIDVAADLDALDRLTGKAKEKVRSRLLEAERQITGKASKLSRKLDKLYDDDRVTTDDWIEKLHEYERLEDMSKAIREKVLR